MDYPAIHLYLLDDPTKEECRIAGQRLAARYGATLKQRTNRAGYKAGAINDLPCDNYDRPVVCECERPLSCPPGSCPSRTSGVRFPACGNGGSRATARVLAFRERIMRFAEVVSRHEVVPEDL